MVGLVGLLIGAVLKILAPYVRNGLEAVAKSGTYLSWPKFDYRYVAMFFLPVLEYGVAFLTLPGVWAATLTWEFVPAVALGYSGADLGKEVLKGAAALYAIVKQRV